MLTIDFLTDYVCPFCLVTKENLRAALKTLHQEAEIIEHPYALTPEGSEPSDICDEEHRAYFARLKEPAETVGLHMQLPPEIRPRPMTYLAFEGAVLAEKSGKHEAWSDRVYRAYWVEGRDIGQIDVLCALAADIGLNADEMRQALENRTYADDVKTAIQHTLDTYHPRGDSLRQRAAHPLAGVHAAGNDGRAARRDSGGRKSGGNGLLRGRMPPELVSNASINTSGAVL